MKNISFDSISEYLVYLEELICGNISNIDRRDDFNSWHFDFQIDGNNYSLFYALLIGTNFKNGKSLHITRRTSDGKLSKFSLQSSDSNRISRIYRKLIEVHVKQLIEKGDFDTKIIIAAITQLLNTFKIQKPSENQFLLTKNTVRYYLTKIDEITIKVEKIFDGGASFEEQRTLSSAKNIWDFLDFTNTAKNKVTDLDRINQDIIELIG